jgi:hypothetical protein
MEMVSFLAGEDFTDHPKCVNNVLRDEAIKINDLVSDDNRSQIALLIPRFMNTEKLNGNDAFRHEFFKAQDQFLEAREMRTDTGSVAHAIKHHFTNDPEGSRRTNQEYDQIGIDWLGVLLDIADKHLGRNQPSAEAVITVLEQAAKHASQKANV